MCLFSISTVGLSKDITWLRLQRKKNYSYVLCHCVAHIDIFYFVCLFSGDRCSWLLFFSLFSCWKTFCADIFPNRPVNSWYNLCFFLSLPTKHVKVVKVSADDHKLQAKRLKIRSLAQWCRQTTITNQKDFTKSNGILCMCAQVYKILITCGDTNNGLMFQKLSAKWVSKQIIEFMNILATDAWHCFTKETSIRQTRKSWIKIQHQDILRTWYPHNSAKLKLLKNDRMFWSQINRVETNWKLVPSLERYTH